MGPPYSACNYLYDAKVVSATVMYPGGSLDALAHPNATIDLQTGQTYNLTLVVHTSQKTVQNDTVALAESRGAEDGHGGAVDPLHGFEALEELLADLGSLPDEVAVAALEEPSVVH